MKNRLILVINPRSSGFSLVEEKILPFLRNETQFLTYEIQPTSPIDNARQMAKILNDNDTILIAGGDGTAHIACNAAILSGRNGLKMKFIGFGNFNDYAHSFSKNSIPAAIQAIKTGETKSKNRPLEIRINGKFFRYAPLYTTIGLTAEMAEIFEGRNLRKTLKNIRSRFCRLALSLIAATRFYFKNRKQHTMHISKIKLNGKEITKLPASITDLVFMNGPRMARIMRSSMNKTSNSKFGFKALNSANLIQNIPFIFEGIIGRLPLNIIKSAEVQFKSPSTISIQIEGEVTKIQNVRIVEVKICDTELNIL